MAGINELTTVVNAVFDLIEEGIKIKKNGAASAMQDIFTLYGDLSAVWAGKDQVGAEAVDLDAAEAQQLAALFMGRMGKVLALLGVAPDSKFGKSLAAMPQILDLAEMNYVKGKAIYEALK